jgi:hypothetical protein
MGNESLEELVALKGHGLEGPCAVRDVREPLGTGWRECDGEAGAGAPGQRGHRRHEPIGIDRRRGIWDAQVGRDGVWNQHRNSHNS